MLAPANLVEIYYFNLGHGPRVDVMDIRGVKLIVCKALGVQITKTFQNLRDNSCGLSFRSSSLLPKILKHIIALQSLGYYIHVSFILEDLNQFDKGGMIELGNMIQDLAFKSLAIWGSSLQRLL